LRYQYLLSYMNQPRFVSNLTLNVSVNTKSDYPHYTMPFGGELNIFSASHLMQQGSLSLTAFCGPVSILYSPGIWSSIHSKELICAIYASKAYALMGTDSKPVVRTNFNQHTLVSILVRQPPSTDDVINLDDVR
jgi:hypothetical protein